MFYFYFCPLERTAKMHRYTDSGSFTALTFLYTIETQAMDAFACIPGNAVSMAKS